MRPFASFTRAVTVIALASLGAGTPVLARTFVYVSNAEDGDIGTYRLLDSGALEPGPRVQAGKMVMPMAVSPDRRHLYAAVRSKPYSVRVYAIDGQSGALKPLSSAPLPESMPYISLDRTGRFLFGASYGGNLVSVSAVDADGRVASEPLQVIPTGRNAHSIRTDEGNRFVYVPTLGSDEIFQFVFDVKTGRLSSNTPSIVLLKPLTGPRHFITAHDNKFLYALSELRGTITTFALDPKTGLLTEVSLASGLPPESKLGPGLPRGAVGGPDAPPPRDTSNDIWAADLHMTPDSKFLYMSERTSSTLAAFSVDAASGKLTYLGSTPTETQPRGFAVDPSGRFVIATGEKSETVSVHAIDPSSGMLKAAQRFPGGKGANWVEVVAFD